jgi:hypothetical protein
MKKRQEKRTKVSTSSSGKKRKHKKQTKDKLFYIISPTGRKIAFFDLAHDKQAILAQGEKDEEEPSD